MKQQVLSTNKIPFDQNAIAFLKFWRLKKKTVICRQFKCRFLNADLICMHFLSGLKQSVIYDLVNLGYKFVDLRTRQCEWLT